MRRLRPATEGVPWSMESRLLLSRVLFCAFKPLKREFVSSASQAAATPEAREMAEPYFQLALSDLNFFESVNTLCISLSLRIGLLSGRS
jgi:hypothetical protein